jgi:hypothetical protein
MLQAFDTVWAGELESCTSTEKGKVPGWVGVPEIIAVVASKVRPSGSCPPEIAHVYGAVTPVTVKRSAYKPETIPRGREVEEVSGTLRLLLTFAGRLAQPLIPIIRKQMDKTRTVDDVFIFFPPGKLVQC